MSDLQLFIRIVALVMLPCIVAVLYSPARRVWNAFLAWVERHP